MDVVRRIADARPDVRFTDVGPRHVEIAFEGHYSFELEHGVAACTRACTASFYLDGEWHIVEMLFGGAAANQETADDVLLIERAEAALAAAKDANSGACPLAGQPSSDAQLALAADLRNAIDRGELFLQYQPKVHVRREVIASAEALIRWNHPRRGVVLPGDFIPAAEEAHLIAPMTLWTIRQAIEDYTALLARGHDLRLFINISGQLLGDTAFVRAACLLVGATEAKLGFEITETSVIHDPQSAIANLQAFADYGVVIAIDDYGAGLSSLAYLKQLPARELKIDRLFVTQLTSSNRDPLIVRSTIDLAHALDMEVVAEGVETHATMALLTVMGCDMIQGFLISRPIGLDALANFLGEDRSDIIRPKPRDYFGLTSARLA